MKLKDITYELGTEMIAPPKMGVIAGDLFDWSLSCKCYIDSIPGLEKVDEICSGLNMEKELPELSKLDDPTFGFCRRYIFYYVLFVPEDMDIAYFPYIPDCDHRHWVNGKLAFIGNTLSVYSIRLNKGYNVICVEKFNSETPFIRIQKHGECCGDPLLSLTKNNYWYKESDFKLGCDRHIQNGEPFKFMLIPLDLIHLSFDDEIHMCITTGERGNIVFERKVSFKEKYEINLSFIPNMNEDKCERLYVYFSLTDNLGRKIEKYTYLFRHEIDINYINSLKTKANTIISNPDLPDLIRNELSFYLYILNDQMSFYYFGYQLKKLLDAIDKKNIQDYLYSPGAHNIYYYSDINQDFHHYYVVFPKNYDQNKKYPVVLTFQYGVVNNYEPIENNPNFSARFADRDDAIFIDIGGDGCTMGSYTGEVFLLAEIKHIKEHFNIDANRIYAIANCAGNIAALNFVETYPHIFAGIYTRSTVDIGENICNLSNVSCIYIFSGKDKWVLNNAKQIKNTLKKVRILYCCECIDRYIDIIHTQFTREAIDYLLSFERTEFPERIHYRTTRNRSRNAYYIEIESIADNNDYSEFVSEIKDNSINIIENNCSGFRIKIPSGINKKRFKVSINNSEIIFKNLTKDYICVKRIANNTFKAADEIEKNINYYKGTGLLDVYLTEVRVINIDINSKELSKVARVFTHPTTNAIARTRIEYPIIKPEEINKDDLYSYIIIDNNCSTNKIIELIRSHLPICMDKYGYYYLGKKYLCNYTIFQIIKSPLNVNKSILYINSNNIKLYEKNIFSRSLKIPSYSTGFHPYLNCVALIFDGYKYYSILHWGKKIEEVLTKK